MTQLELMVLALLMVFFVALPLCALTAVIYAHGKWMKDLSGSCEKLADYLFGLPQNLRGLPEALERVGAVVDEHCRQVGGLVGVIGEASKERPEPFRENGPETDFSMSMPPPAFEEPDESR